MATIRRAGFGTVFELEDSKVGIGTDAATHTLQALGNIRSEAATDIGISSLTTYQGFVDKEARFTTGQIDNQSQSGSTSGEIVIDGDVTVSSATTFTSGPQNLTVTDTFTLPSGDTNSRELKPTPGSFRFNQDFATLEFYTGNNWATVNTFTEMQNSPGNRGRGVFAAGVSGPAETRTIDFINIASQGNALDFGIAFPQVESRVTGTGNAVRGIFAGTNDTDSHDIIEYITTASAGDSIDFGNLTVGRGTMGAAASSTRGIFMAGRDPSSTNVIDYIEIMTTGNAIDFGDCTETADWVSCNNSTTRAIRMGGENPVAPSNQGGRLDTIDFVNIQSKGNATNFGVMSMRRGETASCSSTTRGITAGGAPHHFRFIDYITMASEGNAIIFGELTGGTTSLAAGVSNSTRGVIAGGYDTSSSTNAIDFVLFSTTGNAQDFGDLTQDRWSLGGASDSHGGLGGF